MIRCRLSTLCGERRVSVAEVARATGIARNTVLALYHDKPARFDRDTLDGLCRYFGVGVGELLIYTPDKDPPDQSSPPHGGR
jgi:putative transcriptional regulator